MGVWRPNSREEICCRGARGTKKYCRGSCKQTGNGETNATSLFYVILAFSLSSAVEQTSHQVELGLGKWRCAIKAEQA